MEKSFQIVLETEWLGYIPDTMPSRLGFKKSRRPLFLTVASTQNLGTEESRKKVYQGSDSQSVSLDLARP